MPRAAPLLLLALLLCGSCHRPARRPNVLLVSIDTLRADHVGLYGYPRDTTPFLDRWSREGMVFEQAYTPAPWTLIAHMTMLTGLYPAQHGVLSENQGLSDAVPALAERLQPLGYQTVGLYRESWIRPRYGFGRGFEVFRPHVDAEEAEDHLLEELERLDAQRPLFLFLHLFDVHNGFDADGDEPLYPSPQPYQDLFLEGPPAPLPDMLPEELWRAQGVLTPPQIERIVARYDGGIRYVDAKLEAWFQRLEQAGWLENTLVIVTSDHGESLGQRGTLDGHGGLAQEGLRVPLLVRLPDGSRAGTRIAEPAHLVDLVPTILDVVDAPREGLPGLTLLEPLPSDRVLVGDYPPQDYVLAWPHKLMRKGSQVLEVDLVRDPGETRLRKAEPARFEELLQRSQALGEGYPAPRQLEWMTSEESEQLQALGYGGAGERDER
jgi:choline-sulfatase